ncbi:MAG: acyl-CoA dehydrogenase family protein [Alphaproteobacteria bacterium]
MNFALTSEQQAIFDVAREFAIDRLAPNAVEWDQKEHLPLDVMRDAAKLGMAGIYMSEDVGGAGLSRLEASLIFEGLSYGCPSIAAIISVQNMCGWMIDEFAADALRREWAPRLASLEVLGAYCLTEPGSGSDAAALRASARRDAGDYIINGSKAFITGANVAGAFIVMARTGGEGARGVSAFLVPRDVAGISVGPPEKKMGWRAQPTAIVQFDDVRIPARNLIGVEGEGFKYAMAGLDGGRLNIASCAMGAAQSALDKALIYVRERHAFGRALAEFQALQFRLADMETELQAARVFLRQAAWKLDLNASDASKHCAMAKRFVTDVSFDVANRALQMFGGYGYLTDFGIEKIVRDLRVHQILEGTNEIMRVIIARSLLREKS